MADPLPANVERELLKVPVWYGEPSKDGFTPEYWVERMDRLKRTFRWNDEITALQACNAFRGKAIWFLHYLKTNDSAARDNWALLKKVFLEHFGIVGKDTSRITNLNIVQGASEKVQVFAYRVSMTVDEFWSCLPESRDSPDLAGLAEVPQLPANQAAAAPEVDAENVAILAAYVQEQKSQTAIHYHKRASNMYFQGVCKVLFLNGLIPSIRTIAKQKAPTTFQEAIKSALVAEQALHGPLDKTIATERNVNFVKRRPNGKGATFSGKKTPGECWYCHQRGHVQLHCRKRLARGASMVSKPRTVQEIQMDRLGYQETDDPEDDAHSSEDSDEHPAYEEDADYPDDDESPDAQINTLHLN